MDTTKKLTVLILDDDDIRHEFMTRRYPDSTWVRTHARTPEEAIEALEKTVFDEVTLDHDLGMAYDPYPREMTGMQVVNHIVQMDPEKRPREVLVHSANIIRAPEMVRRLRDAGIRRSYQTTNS